MNKVIVLILIFTMLFNLSAYAANYPAYKSYLKAVMAQKSGKIDTAKAEYENVVAYDKTAIPAYRELINIYKQSGDTQKALETAELIKELDGDSAKTNMFLGTFYLTANEMALAKQAWEKVLELEPSNETATVYLAAYYYSDNKLQESVDYWNKFLQQQPESPEGYFQLGLVQEKLGKFDDALKSYKKTNELKPEAKEAYLARARIYETKKQYASAISEYEKYTEIFPDNIAVLLYLSKCYFEEQRYAKAEETLMKAKKIAPSNMTVYYLLGIVYERQKNIPKAIDVFESIIKKEPVASSFARLGYYYALEKDYKSADKNFAKAIELESLNWEYFYFAGLNAIDAKKSDEAEKYLNKALLFNPDNLNVKFYLATVYADRKDFDSATKQFDEILAVEPNNVKVLNYLGYMYAENNINLDRSETLLLKANSLAPEDTAVLDSVAWMYYKTARYQQAEEYMLRIMNKTPKVYDKVILEHFGDINVELGKLEDAWYYYSLSADIGSKDATKKMKLVEKKCDDSLLAKMYAKRALSNFERIFALKATYKLKIAKNNFKMNSLANAVYAKQFGLKLKFVQNLTIPEFYALFREGHCTIAPKTVSKYLDDGIVEMTSFANFVLSQKFADFILSSSVITKGNKIYFTDQDGVCCAVINKKNGQFCEISKTNVMKIKISSYKKLNDVTIIPSAMKFESSSYKFTCDVKSSKIKSLNSSDIYEIEKEFTGNANEDKSTGKN